MRFKQHGQSQLHVCIYIERDIESRDSITDDEDGVAEVAVHVAELLGGRRGGGGCRYRRELMQRREVLHQERRRQLRGRREHRGGGGSGGRRGRGGRHADRGDRQRTTGRDDQWIAAFFRYVRVRGASNSRLEHAKQHWAGARLLASCPDLTRQRTERWWCT